MTTQSPEEIAQKKQVLFLKGEDQHSSKLTEDTVREMRELAANGANSYECGLAFDVSQSTAYKAIVGKSWKHVQ